MLGAAVSTPAWAAFTASGTVQLSATAQAPDGDSRSWQVQGFNTLGVGEGAEVEARLGLYFASENTDAVSFFGQLTGLARTASFTTGGRSFGPLEAFIDVGSLDFEGWRVRAGQAFAGTSQENTEEFWQTPYTLNLSAINTWIGEEFRPIGLGFAKRWRSKGASTDFEVGAFMGNDTGPALLAWRGFALHNRLSVFGEAVPLPRQISLGQSRPGVDPRALPGFDVFGVQRDVGSQPFGPDLDGRAGFSLRYRRQADTGATLSLFYSDNRGDQDLHNGDEYAWRNRFGTAGFTLPFAGAWSVLGEAMFGRTEMGFAPLANVIARYDAQYVLLSRTQGDWTLSGRLERFAISEQDFSVAERNDQRGFALTASAQRNFGDWRAGFEYSYADIRRPGLVSEGFNSAQGGSQLMLMLRYYFPQ